MCEGTQQAQVKWLTTITAWASVSWGLMSSKVIGKYDWRLGRNDRKRFFFEAWTNAQSHERSTASHTTESRQWVTPETANMQTAVGYKKGTYLIEPETNEHEDNSLSIHQCTRFVLKYVGYAFYQRETGLHWDRSYCIPASSNAIQFLSLMIEHCVYQLLPQQIPFSMRAVCRYRIPQVCVLLLSYE